MVKNMDTDVNFNRESNGLDPPSLAPLSGGSDFVILARPSLNGPPHSDVSDLSMMQSLQTLDSLTSDMPLEEAVNRVKSLMRENIGLKENLTETNDTMKKQISLITEWKHKYDAGRMDTKEKLELTKKVVMTLKLHKAQAEKKVEELEEELRNKTDNTQLYTEEVKLLKGKIGELSQTNEFLENSKLLLQKSVDEMSCEIENMRKKIEMGSKQSIEEVVVQSSPDYMNLKKQQLQLEQTLETNQNALQDKEEQLELVNAERKELKDTLNESQELNEKLQKQLVETSRENNELKVKNTSLKSKLQKTKEINDRLIHEKNGLIATNSQLMEEKSMQVAPPMSMGTSSTMSSSQGNGGFSILEDIPVEEESHQGHSASVQVQAKTKSIPDHSVSELIGQLTEERHKVSTLQDKVSSLQQELDKKQGYMEEANTQITSLRDRHKEEITRLQSEVQQAIQNTPQSLTEVNEKQLKAQVVSLHQENESIREQLNDAKVQFDRKKSRCNDLQQQIEAVRQELEEQRGKDDDLIDQLRIAIGQIETNVQSEKSEKDAIRTSYGELRNNFDQLCKDYHELLDEFEGYRAEQDKKNSERSSPEFVAMRETLDNVTARLFSAEETMKAKNDENSQLRREMMRLQQKIQNMQSDTDAIPILKATMEGYRSDFDEERQARERMHEENQRLKSEINDLQTHNQQLQDEVQNLSRKEMSAMMKRHGSYSRRGYGSPFSTNTSNPFAYHEGDQRPFAAAGEAAGYVYGRAFDDAQTSMAASLEEHSIHPNERNSDSNSDVVEPLLCPKCEMVCPDIDTLQIHVSSCLDQD